MPRTLLDLVDHLTERLHEVQRALISETSVNLSRDYARLRLEINAFRAEAGLGPSPVEPRWDGEEDTHAAG